MFQLLISSYFTSSFYRRHCICVHLFPLTTENSSQPPLPLLTTDPPQSISISWARYFIYSKSLPSSVRNLLRISLFQNSRGFVMMCSSMTVRGRHGNSFLLQDGSTTALSSLTPGPPKGLFSGFNHRGIVSLREPHTHRLPFQTRQTSAGLSSVAPDPAGPFFSDYRCGQEHISLTVDTWRNHFA